MQQKFTNTEKIKKKESIFSEKKNPSILALSDLWMLDCASRMCLNVASRLSFLCVTPIFTGIQMDVLDANTGRLVLLEFTDPHLHEQELGRDEHSELMLPRHQKCWLPFQSCKVGGTALGMNSSTGVRPLLKAGQTMRYFPCSSLLSWECQDPQDHQDLPCPSPLQTLSAPGSSWALNTWSSSAFLALHSKGSLLLILPILILQLSLAQQCQPPEPSPPS